MNAKELYILFKDVEKLWLQKEEYTLNDIREIKKYLGQYCRVLEKKLDETNIEGLGN